MILTFVHPSIKIATLHHPSCFAPGLRQCQAMYLQRPGSGQNIYCSEDDRLHHFLLRANLESFQVGISQRNQNATFIKIIVVKDSREKAANRSNSICISYDKKSLLHIQLVKQSDYIYTYIHDLKVSDLVKFC